MAVVRPPASGTGSCPVSTAPPWPSTFPAGPESPPTWPPCRWGTRWRPSSPISEHRRLEPPVTLVAHSSGGLVVPGVVAATGGLVGSVVLNPALVPTQGGCGIDCMKPRHREGLVLAREAAERDGTSITLPGPPQDPESFRNAYGGDPLDDDALAYVVDPVRCVPDTVHHYFQPVYWSAVAGVPIVYVLNRRDRPVPPETQEEMVQRLPEPASAIRVESGHLLAVTAPAVFAEILAGVGT